MKREEDEPLLWVPPVSEGPQTPTPQVEREEPRAPRKSSQPGQLRTHKLYTDGSLLDSQTTDSQAIRNLVEKGKERARSPTPAPSEPETPQSQYKLLPFALAAMVADGRVTQAWADQHELPTALGLTALPFDSFPGGPSGSNSIHDSDDTVVAEAPGIEIQPQPAQEPQGNLPVITTPPRAGHRQVPATAPQPGRVLPPSASELALLQRLREFQTDRGESLMEMLAEARREEQVAVLESRVLGRENARLRKELEKQKTI
ncbi:hypothetical protein EST38_g11032 [Candolleomyces aberdarensis]|uniref:Uncharacterized protein n=1 Tax=Candolleomyces aberdarensis TaxID=2316362 RepID=A0A4Q2D8N6_9AGAR|nr:hypothetical protein EST38_g11032 [Candolleomyces aberdarensis]